MVFFNVGIENLNPDVRDKAVGYITRHIDRALRYQQDYRRGCLPRCFQKLASECSMCCGKIYGNYLAALHLLTKILYVASSVGQLFVLAEFIGDGFFLYGVDALRDIIKKKYHNSKLFPRITLCDVDIRQFSNVQMFTVQCALPINLFNEKVYLIIWFWLVFVSIINMHSLLLLLWNAFLPSRKAFVVHHLKTYLNGMSSSTDLPSPIIHKFIRDYLRQDGVLILRMIHANTNNVIACEVVGGLWDLYERSNHTYGKSYSDWINTNINIDKDTVMLKNSMNQQKWDVMPSSRRNTPMQTNEV